MEYRYSLQKYEGMKTRFTCPSCNKPKKFTRYVDNETGLKCAEHVGRCERVDNCGYHYTPKEYFKDNDLTLVCSDWSGRKILRKSPSKREMSQISHEHVKGCIKGLEKSSLVKFLYNRFGKENTAPTISKYLIGQLYYWKENNPVFWQIDIKGRVRTGKIMKYNQTNGKRIKKPRSYINWMHNILKYQNYYLAQCLFGEHLLTKYPQKVIGVVESEKTALIASILFDELLWLATGGKTNMKADKFEVLANRKVCLFPDINSFDEWSYIADNLSSTIPDISVSDLLERKASDIDRKEGYDLADYILTDIAQG